MSFLDSSPSICSNKEPHKGVLHTVRFEKVIHSIFAIGFSHHTSSAAVRSSYSLSDEQKEVFLRRAANNGLNSCAVLSTCNRTEIYGYGNVEDAASIYLDILGDSGPNADMIRKSGLAAIQHIFKVSAGLDSQVIGDLEILSQFKQAFINAKRHKMLDGFLERLVNNSLAAAKEVRSSTRISSGTVSLSYAATRYIRDRYEGRPCQVLIVGAGKFGSRIAKNLHDYFPEAARKISNRTKEKATAIVEMYGGEVADFEDLAAAITEADVIISSVNDASDFVINATNVSQGTKDRLFIDMSIPLSIDPELANLDHTELITLDEVGQVINSTLEARKEDIPLAEEIISKYIAEFCSWAELYDKSKSIVEWKKTIRQMIAACPYLSTIEESQKNRIIGRSVATFAAYLKQRADLPTDTEEIIAQFMKDTQHVVDCSNLGLQPPTETACPTCLTP